MKTKPSYALRLPPSLKRAAERRAAEDGVSLNHWINMAIAEKAAAAGVAAYIRRRFGAAQPDQFGSAAGIESVDSDTVCGT